MIRSLLSLFLTILIFSLFKILQKKTNLSLLNPLLFSSVFLIIALLVLNIDYQDYIQGADILSSLIGPATVALAIPLYKHQNLLKKHVKTILTSVFIASLFHALLILIFSILFEFNLSMALSFIPKSVTAAIAIDLSTSMNAYTNITVIAVVITGILGASLAPLLNRVFKIDKPISQGLALGTSAHAVGTAKAIELGKTQEIMASLALILTGVITVLIAPIVYIIFTTLI